MGTRESILEKTKNLHLTSVDYPEEPHSARPFRNPERIFREFLAAAHGEWKEFPSLEASLDYLSSWEEARAAKSTCDLSGFLRGKELPLTEVDQISPEGEIDIVVASGKIGVAENAAVWVGPPSEGRAALFLAKHLVILLPREAIVSSMHDAYALLNLEDSSYGTFIAGPSKTADIAQKLVLGAHGPLTLSIFAYSTKLEAGL